MQKGTTHSKESKARMSASAYKRPPRSQATRDKISASMKASHARKAQAAKEDGSCST